MASGCSAITFGYSATVLLDICIGYKTTRLYTNWSMATLSLSRTQSRTTSSKPKYSRYYGLTYLYMQMSQGNNSGQESSMYMVTYQPTSKQQRNPYKLIGCFPIQLSSAKNYSEQVLQSDRLLGKQF
jgi:hypothetical protein